MMREIVDDRDAVDLSFYFQTALHALELFKCAGNNVYRNPVIRSHSRRRRGVPDVVFASQRKLKLRPGFSVLQDRPSSAIGFQLQICDPPCCVVRSSITLHGTKSLRKRALDAVAGIEGDDASAARDEIHETLERSLNRIEVLINICVIEFDRRQDDGVRKIVQEFRTFIEECGVVFIAFQDEVFAVSKLETAAEIFCDSANQERRMSSRALKDPGKHR